MISPGLSAHEWSRVVSVLRGRSTVVGRPHGPSRALVSWLRLLPPPSGVRAASHRRPLSAAQALGDRLGGDPVDLDRPGGSTRDTGTEEARPS